ncbi:hypothetical protein [Polymorphobacter sp.]|uniref:hypothetical protein n=1 Tax=Polymorphobacter sp. TaxID=1909290 RepID=UPI003F708B0B
MIELPRKAKGERPVYLGDSTTDNLLAIMLAMAGEFVVLRERLDTVERVVGNTELKAMVDAYRPTKEVAAEREAWRAQFLDIVLRPVTQDYEDLAQKADAGDYDGAIAVVLQAD